EQAAPSSSTCGSTKAVPSTPAEVVAVPTTGTNISTIQDEQNVFIANGVNPSAIYHRAAFMDVLSLCGVHDEEQVESNLTAEKVARLQRRHKYLMNGNELDAEDFDEDPTRIIDGQAKGNEINEIAEDATAWEDFDEDPTEIIDEQAEGDEIDEIAKDAAP
ncbi:unnamed protein product, partial [Porites lobata]